MSAQEYRCFCNGLSVICSDACVLPRQACFAAASLEILSARTSARMRPAVRLELATSLVDLGCLVRASTQPASVERKSLPQETDRNHEGSTPIRDCGPVTIALAALALVGNPWVRLLRLRDRWSEGGKVYIDHSYVASNGSCFISSWKTHLFIEVGA